MSFGLIVRRFLGRISGPEVPHFCFPKTALESSPFLSLFREFYFGYAVVSWKILGQELRFLFWNCSWSVPGVRFCMVSVLATGSFFRRFWVPVFFFGPSLSFPPSPSPPPSLLGTSPGAPSLLPCACWQDTGHPVPGQAGAPWLHMSFFFFSPLSARVGCLPPLPPPLPFLSFFFLFLSLSLSCMHSDTEIISGNRSGSCSEKCGGRIAQVVGCHFVYGIL